MLARAREFLARKGFEEARLEAELLVAHALGTDRLGLFLRLDAPPHPGEIDAGRQLLMRRAEHEPVAYLIGAREFYGRDFAVGPGVLVPRPETELLVDRARALGLASGARVLDVGTGSGVLAVTLELEAARVLAVDVSEEALVWARRNAETLAAGQQLELLQGDGLEVALARGPFELVVSNPPYIDPAQAHTLAPDVREHEPPQALFGPAGDHGAWVRELTCHAHQLLAPGGTLLVELGHDQGEHARSSALDAGLQPELHSDLAGITRVLEVRVPEA